MPDDEVIDEVTEETAPEVTEQTPEQKALSAANAEAAKWRKQLREEQAKVKQYEDAQKSEAERSAERVAELERRLAEKESKELRQTVCEKAGLPLKYASRLVGADESELLADAKDLAKDLKAAGTSESGVRGGADNGGGVRRPAKTSAKGMNGLIAETFGGR